MNVSICFDLKAYYRALADNDSDFFLLVFPRCSELKEANNRLYISLEPKDSSELVQKVTSLALGFGVDAINSSLNNCCYYGFSTVFNVVSQVRNILENLEVESVFLCGHKNSGYVPIYLTSWGESSVNLFTSTGCFSPYIYQALIRDHIVVWRHGDARNLSKGFLGLAARYVTIPLMSALRSFRSWSMFSAESSRFKVKYIFIARTQHQFFVALNVLKSLDVDDEDVLFVVFESLSSSGLRSKIESKGYSVHSLNNGIGGIFQTFLSLLRSYGLGLMLFVFGRRTFSYEGVSYCVSNILFDVCLQPQIYQYCAALRRFRKKLLGRSDLNIFSFEQVSPQAYYDQKILGSKYCLHFIKSTLIQNITMPCISWGERFYVNSPEELDLSQFSYLNSKAIVYSGSPKYTPIYNLKNNYSKELSNILFASQPHEPEVNFLILKRLADIGLHQNFKIVVRPHPRDKADYASLGISNVTVFSSDDIYKQLANSDLVVARTSTVLEECIYIGVPFMSCLISAKDQSYSAKYLDLDSGLVASDLDSIGTILKDYNRTLNNYFSFREEYLVGFEKFKLLSN